MRNLFFNPHLDCIFAGKIIISFMDFQMILLNYQNNIAHLTINQPTKLNALNKQVFNELDQAIDLIAQNEAVKGIIITGAGEKAFVAGADITEFKNYSVTQAVEDLSKKGQRIFRKIELFSKPVIAAVNGFALGGGLELAMACHLRVASENARFGQPEVNLGLIPGYGGTQRLVQLIGKGKALELLMTADIIKAPEALQLGLVNHVVPQAYLIQKCEEIITKIGSKGPVAIAKIIACVDNYFNYDGNAFDKEAELFGTCFGTKDYVEGTSAFLEKRKADFKGN